MSLLKRPLVLLLLAAAVLPAVAFAARAKRGVYRQRFPASQTQVVIAVAKGGKRIVSFSGPCVHKNSTTLAYTIQKKIAISKKGKFSFHGKVGLAPPADSHAGRVAIRGRFTNIGRRVKGTITGHYFVSKKRYGCKKITFNAPYLGNPTNL